MGRDKVNSAGFSARRWVGLEASGVILVDGVCWRTRERGRSDVKCDWAPADNPSPDDLKSEKPELQTCLHLCFCRVFFPS